MVPHYDTHRYQRAFKEAQRAMATYTTREQVVTALRQMADTNWCGSQTDRMELAHVAADLIEMYGQSADETQRKLTEINSKLDTLLAG